MVGVTGLEPATSRPPAVRATNCATPRYRICNFQKEPRRVTKQPFGFLLETRWVSAICLHGDKSLRVPKALIFRNHCLLLSLLKYTVLLVACAIRFQVLPVQRLGIHYLALVQVMACPKSLIQR